MKAKVLHVDSVLVYLNYYTLFYTFVQCIHIAFAHKSLYTADNQNLLFFVAHMKEIEKEARGNPVLTDQIGYILIHLSPLLIIWTGATIFDWIMCASLYFIRFFFVTSGYHRYFSHASYKTSRVFQFILAFMSQTSLQKGALWWASHHRLHHRHSDTSQDPHSPRLYGFWYAHMGWFLSRDYLKTHYELIKDFAKFPELRWLNRYHALPWFCLMGITYLIGGYVNSGGDTATMWTAGLSTIVVGYLLSTVLVYHGTYTINSLMHIWGKQRYPSNDDSKNSFLLALITMGEGWHNNHHYFQASARQGFFWWEIDLTFYILKILSWLGIVWDLRPVPTSIKNSRTKEEAVRLAKQEKNYK